MREMLSQHPLLWAKDLETMLHSLLMADSQVGHMVLYRSYYSEAYEGGPIAIIENGDTITIDAENRELKLHVSDDEIQTRLSNWKRRAPHYTRGVLAKYASSVSSASEGAVTDKVLKV